MGYISPYESGNNHIRSSSSWRLLFRVQVLSSRERERAAGGAGSGNAQIQYAMARAYILMGSFFGRGAAGPPDLLSLLITTWDGPRTSFPLPSSRDNKEKKGKKEWYLIQRRGERPPQEEETRSTRFQLISFGSEPRDVSGNSGREGPLGRRFSRLMGKFDGLILIQ